MGSWEQSPFSFFMSYNAACNYFMMTLISHSFIKVTSTIFSDFFFILVDFLALTRGGGVEGLKREWNGYSILELPLTQTQSTKLLVIFSVQKHYTGKLPESNSSAGTCLFSCQPAQALAGEAAGAGLQSTAPARLEGAGKWKLPSMTCLWAPSFPLFSSPSFPNKKLLGCHNPGGTSSMKGCSIFIRHFHQMWGYLATSLLPVFSFSEQWSEFKELQCQCRVFGHVVLPLLTHPSATEHRLYWGHVCVWLQGDSHQGCSTSGSSRCPQCVHWWCGKQIWII